LAEQEEQRAGGLNPATREFRELSEICPACGEDNTVLIDIQDTTGGWMEKEDSVELWRCLNPKCWKTFRV